MSGFSEQELNAVKSLGGIIDLDSSVSFSGVKLPKAQHENSLHVPRHYAEFHPDDYSLEIMRNLATAMLLRHPVLFEGGTSLGKTTAVRQLAALLGYEVHYLNFNGLVDPESMMGRFIPFDGGYTFRDGPVTRGLRQEPGKRKIILLDELGSAKPNMLIRLHEVLDALEKNAPVTLTESENELVATDSSCTHLVALTNPPGQGFLGKEPLDPALLRRWIYQKLVNQLPPGVFVELTNVLFGQATDGVVGANVDVVVSRDDAMTIEELAEIPGIIQILEKYREFHKFAQSQVALRKVGKDQPQRFTFDDRMEPRRVRDFFLHFYAGDINETMLAALKYFYVNKLETESDRQVLLEAARQVIYVPRSPIRSQRIALAGNDGYGGT